MNRVTLAGNVESSPKAGIANGIEYCNFTVATFESFFNRYGLPVERILWHHIVAFGQLARNANQQIQSGSSIQVVGRLNYRSYVGKDNSQRTMTEIIASTIQFNDVQTSQNDQQAKTVVHTNESGNFH